MCQLHCSGNLVLHTTYARSIFFVFITQVIRKRQEGGLKPCERDPGDMPDMEDNGEKERKGEGTATGLKLESSYVTLAIAMLALELRTLPRMKTTQLTPLRGDMNDNVAVGRGETREGRMTRVGK